MTHMAIGAPIEQLNTSGPHEMGPARVTWANDDELVIITIRLPLAVVEGMAPYEQILFGIGMTKDSGPMVTYRDDGSVSDETFERYRLSLMDRAS